MDATSEYQARLTARRKILVRAERADSLIADIRLAVFLGFVGTAWAAWKTEAIGFGWVFVPLVAFVFLLIAHERTLRRLARAKLAVAYYELGLRRLTNQWQGSGSNGLDWVPKPHLYAADLDIFGTGSLFELLCTAQTRVGQKTLAAWLCGPTPAEELSRRHESVAALRGELDLQEELVIAAGGAQPRLHPDSLVTWAEAPLRLQTPGLSWAFAAVSMGAIASLVAWAMAWVGPGPFVGILVVQWVLGRVYGNGVANVLELVAPAQKELRALARVLGVFERAAVDSPKLQVLQTTLGGKASGEIDALGALVQLADSSGNQFFQPFGFVLMWRLQCAIRIEAWRRRCGPLVNDWLVALGELEALGAIANYAYENPDDVFPEIVDGSTSLLVAEGLGHPLLSTEVSVRNDVELDATCSAWVVSGSNMSGKSTLLRSIGANAVLAFAGAPVRAHRFKASVFEIGATLSIHDSLQDGSSRFYAEIQRLRELLSIADGPNRLLFLVDEILHGTNSHDRAIGALAVLEAFVQRGALGLVTTHDLALASQVEERGISARNVHFEDQMEGDALVFDYILRDGQVTRGNALNLMRSVGLPV